MRTFIWASLDRSGMNSYSSKPKLAPTTQPPAPRGGKGNSHCDFGERRLIPSAPTQDELETTGHNSR